MRFRRLWLLIILAFVLLLGLPSAATFYTDWLWFKELGYNGVFLTTVNAELSVFSATFVIAFAFLYINLRLARRAMRVPHLVVGGAGGRAQPLVIEGRRINTLALIVSLVVALLVGYMAQADWLLWLSYIKAVPFGVSDPLLHRDVAYYVFRLPIYDDVRQSFLLLSFIALGGCGAIYLLSGNIVLEQRYGMAFWPKLKLVPAARRHLALLAACIFALMAWGAWLDITRLLISPANQVFGASYANVYADLPFLRITIAVLVLGVVLALVHGAGSSGWPIPVAIALYLLVSISGGIYSGFVARFVVTASELEKERPFILNNIAATRRAYALDHVTEQEISGDADLSPKDIVANADTIENVPLWDHGPLLQTFAQLQELRTYYAFANVDNDRYVIDGRTRQVMLSARELNTDNLPSRSWVNDHLSYTHGYGLTLGPVNQVSDEGLPVLFIKDLPPVTMPGVNLPITQPAIYYGELTKSYALVNTLQPEFDYPKDKEEVTTKYHGTGGVVIGNFFRRLLFAMRFGTTELVFTNQLTEESRIMFHRQITDRVQTIAPFLTFDPDPYPVVSGGRIFWIQDAYTTTANYPYSTPTDALGLNYIRNSVKVVIDAYNGDTTFYLADPDDPLALTLARIFPGLLRPMSEMPADLRKHVRYPELIFSAQAAMFATYHMTDPTVFYNKEDQWQVPVLDNDRSPTPMQPYYTVMKLPGATHTEFMQMLPFTPRSKPNLSAWFVAQSDGADYGHLVSFEFPKQKIIYGPLQIVGRINQDQTISPIVTLWDQQGSHVDWGTLLVIPIEQSLLYVRPLYLRASNGSIPELKRVVVAYHDQIVMDETLTLALGKIFGPQVANALRNDRMEGQDLGLAIAPPPAGAAPLLSSPALPSGELADLIAQANDHWDLAQKALRDGDLATYANEVNKVGDLIKRMGKGK